MTKKKTLPSLAEQYCDVMNIEGIDVPSDCYKKFSHVLYEDLIREQENSTVSVGGKTYIMTFTRWLKRYDKKYKHRINQIIKKKRTEVHDPYSIRGRYYYPQPYTKTLPLVDDRIFLESFYDYACRRIKWIYNGEYSKGQCHKEGIPFHKITHAKTDMDTVAWFLPALHKRITMLRLKD